jgi:ABC-type phosphate/phosphonate transport system substrate-binding protein
MRSWNALNAALRSRGVDASVEVLESNRAVARALGDRFIDVGLLDPYWFLRYREALLPLAEAVAPGDRPPSVLLIVPRNSIVYRIDQLEDFTLALPSDRDTAKGYYVPLAMLSRAGIRIITSDTDVSVLKGVAYGGIDAGCLSGATFMDERYAHFAAEVRVVAESEALPPPLLAIRRDDGEEKYRQLRDALTPAFGPPALKEYGTLERYLRSYKAAYDAED